MIEARLIQVRGIVQGVGFRPLVFRLAQEYGLTGWVLNEDNGVQIHLEGSEAALSSFMQALPVHAPIASHIAQIKVEVVAVQGYGQFEILESQQTGRPTTRISPDLSVCDDCLRELYDPNNRRYLYPYINCTHCGPRHSVILALPYDRPNTTVHFWPMCPDCESEYHDPLNRRFHAQPTACPVCGPDYFLLDYPDGGARLSESNLRGHQAIVRTAALLREGKIVAIKGIGGYHLACNAQNSQTVQILRARKFRKEKPFALMVADVKTARAIVHLTPEAESLLTSTARPIVLAPLRIEFEGVSPDNTDLGVMLPYTPLHQLLFSEGAPKILVFTSANRSSEPIAYHDQEAFDQLSEIADAFLVGERPIARRLDDSVVQSTGFGPRMVRRSRGYAPAAVAEFPTSDAILALGGDLKNSPTLVVEGQAFVGQFLGDLEHLSVFEAFQEAVSDFLNMYALNLSQLTIVCDLHPQYRSTQFALGLPAKRHINIQHHQAHIASVLAEHGLWGERILGIALDGTGFGGDGAIWGGEFFVGALTEGFRRVAHLRCADLVGGDAAAGYPVQAAVGFVGQLESLPNLTRPPFNFPTRYIQVQKLYQARLHTFPTTSTGRLFDTVAALLGFTKAISFEGQAAIWLEHLARQSLEVEAYPLPFANHQLDFRPMLMCIIEDRLKGRDPAEMARAFHEGLARGVFYACLELTQTHGVKTVACSGGVFQNVLLSEKLHRLLSTSGLNPLFNRQVPPNDGGVSLGQAALVGFEGA